MIDQVSVIWADGEANINRSLTADDLYLLQNVVALTAVFGPGSDKLSTYTIVRVPDGVPSEGEYYYRTQLIKPDGIIRPDAIKFDFRKAVDSLLAEVNAVLGGGDE